MGTPDRLGRSPPTSFWSVGVGGIGKPGEPFTTSGLLALSGSSRWLTARTGNISGRPGVRIVGVQAEASGWVGKGEKAAVVVADRGVTTAGTNEAGSGFGARPIGGKAVVELLASGRFWEFRPPVEPLKGVAGGALDAGSETRATGY
jgi:hypothetical protein